MAAPSYSGEYEFGSWAVASAPLPWEANEVVRPARPLTSRCPVDPFRYLDYRAFLTDFYRAQKRRRGFSYRAFAKAAGLSAPNYLQLVVAGKRNLTDDTAARFATACGLSADSAEYFQALVRFNQAGTDEERNARYRKLTAFRRYRRAHKLELAHAAYHASWYVPAIRELAASPRFREDPEWIASTLQPEIKPREAAQALATLLELGLLRRNPDGRLEQQTRVLSTGPETLGMHIRNYHAEMMQRATAAMAEFPAADRDVSSLTMCVGPEVLAEIKERIRSFRRELIELVSSQETPTRVLQLNLQLFPLSSDVGQAGAPARKPST